MGSELEDLRTEVRALAEGHHRLDEAIGRELTELTVLARRAQEAATAGQRSVLVEQRRVAALEDQLDRARRELGEIRTSESYRVGNALTRIARRPTAWIRRLVRRAAPRVRRTTARTVTRLESDPRARRVVARLGPRVTNRIASSGAVSRVRDGSLARGGSGRPGSALATGTGLVVDLRGEDAEAFASEDLEAPGEDAPDVVVDDGMRPDEAPHLDDDGTVRVATAGVCGPPPICVRSWHPIGFARESDGTVVRLLLPGDEPQQPPPDALPPGRQVVDITVDGDLEGPEAFRRAVQARLAVLEDGSGSGSPRERAALVVRALAVGCPVRLHDDDPDMDRALGEELAARLRAVDLHALTDPLTREQTSHRLRNWVHRHAASREFWSRVAGDLRPVPPAERSVSVTLPTNRPDLVGRWVHMLARQDHPDFEVVACLHGPGFGPEHEGVIGEVLGDRVTVRRVPDTRLRLGDVLNEGLDAASGDLVVKWDDDDLYSSRHLGDLVAAHAYSGATIVGKAAEFVHLGEIDVTVRRFSGSMEGWSRTIGGTTLTIRRDDLRAVGGWRRSPRRVDSRLIDAVLAAGGTAYRTAGFGLLVIREAAATDRHTWNPDVSYFLDNSVEQRRGLALDLADVDVDPAELHTAPR